MLAINPSDALHHLPSHPRRAGGSGRSRSRLERRRDADSVYRGGSSQSQLGAACRPNSSIAARRRSSVGGKNVAATRLTRLWPACRRALTTPKVEPLNDLASDERLLAPKGCLEHLLDGLRLPIAVPGLVGGELLAGKALSRRPLHPASRAPRARPKGIPYSAARRNALPTVLGLRTPFALWTVDIGLF